MEAKANGQKFCKYSGATFYIDRHICKQFTEDQRDLALVMFAEIEP